MTRVYVLQHEYELENGVENVKLIGVYSTRQNAEAAIERLRAQAGFSSYPDGFCIDEYSLDRDHWAEGFFTAE